MEFIPLTLIMPLYFIGLLTKDFVFDLATNKAYTITYYQGCRTATYPADVFVPIAILVTILPLIIRIVHRRKLLDFLTGLIVIGCLALFIVKLLPLQTAIGKSSNAKSEEALSMMAEVKYYHYVMLGSMVTIAILQILSHRDAKMVYIREKTKNN
jgi:hypothetical protein